MKKNIKQVKKQIKLKNIKFYIDSYGLLDAGDSKEANKATLELFSKMTTKQLANISWLASRAFAGGYRCAVSDIAIRNIAK